MTKDAVYNAMLDHLNEILMNEPHDVHFDLDEHDEVLNKGAQLFRNLPKVKVDFVESHSKMCKFVT